ncbi:hypothetical protein FQN49_001731 [Arthroderma sp. PD_2]|nr:hypothetical protein FQN49_001731 [Arthroderma sp. PD_2]
MTSRKPPGRPLTRPTPEHIETARRTNPVGVHVVELGIYQYSFYRKQSIVAGYLKNCNGTAELRTIVTKLHQLFNEYGILRTGNCRYTSAGPHQKAATTIPSFKRLHRFLNNIRINTLALALVNADAMKPISSSVARSLSPRDDETLTSLMGYVITANLLIKIIKQSPLNFDEVSTYSPENGCMLPNNEDMHRSYALLRIWSQINEDDGTTKWKGEPARILHYFNRTESHNQAKSPIDNMVLPDQSLLLDFEPPSIPPSEDGEAETDIIDTIEKQLNDAAGDRFIIERNHALANLPTLTMLEKASLVEYAKSRLNVEADKWPNYTTAMKPGDTPSSETKMPLQRSQDAKMLEEKRERTNTMQENLCDTQHNTSPSLSKAPSDFDGWDYVDNEEGFSGLQTSLDHASMPTLSRGEAAFLLGINIEEPILFPDAENSLSLLQHQLTGVGTLVARERQAQKDRAKGNPTLSATILADDMGLGSTIEVLADIFKCYQLGIQSPGKRRISPGITLLCVPPQTCRCWWSDYQEYFAGKLRMFLVGGSFRRQLGSPFTVDRISIEEFECAVLTPEKSSLFPFDDGPGRTIFMISHFSFKKFTLTSSKKCQATPNPTELLSEIAPLQSALPAMDGLDSSSIRSNLNQVRALSTDEETEDEGLMEEAKKFEHFLVNFSSKFTGMVYRIVVDEGHVMRHPGSDISRAIKLLDPKYLLIVTATPLLDKRTDLYGYAHLFYNNKWELK